MNKSRRYITVSVTAFICYCNTLWGSFVFDDTEAIVKNKDVMPYTPVYDIFKNDFWGTDISLNSSHKSYRPLTILSYRLNVIYTNNKLDAFQFHATNIILYGLLCLLTIPVYELFLRKNKKLYNEVDDVAYFSSLLFTVHPVHTESVAALVGRADILSSILFLVTILLYHQVLTRKSFLFFSVVVCCVASAVLCKETAITALGACTLYDVFYTKKIKVTWLGVFKYKFILRNLTLLCCGLVILYYRFKVMNFEGPTFTSIDNPAAYSESLLTRFLSYNYIYCLNLLLLIWPQWLCFDWSMGCVPLIDSVCDSRVILVILFWLWSFLTAYSLIKAAIKQEYFDSRTMGVMLMILPFVPASNLFFKVGFVIAERTLLLPSAGFCFLVILGLKRLESYFEKNKMGLSIIFYMVCVIFAMRVIQRNIEWLTEEKLFASALEVCPLNAKVHYNVAKIAADRNDKDLAFYEYQKAIELNPNYEQAMNNLANLLREDKKFKSAEVLLRRALDIRPNFAAAWMNLGIVLTNLNQSEEAEHCYNTAIMYRNKYPDCYYNLGNLYLDMKRNEEALKAWEMAVLYRPTHVAAWSNTLVLLDSMHKYDEVLDLGRTALIHNPKSPALHFSIGNTLGKLQQFEKAEGHFLEAINLNPTNGLYYSNLGVLYHRWGKPEKARGMYKKALELDPNLKTTEINLKKLSNAQK